MLSKIKHGFLLFVVVAASAANLFTLTRPASAAMASVYIDPKVSEDVKASGYRVGMAICMTMGYAREDTGLDTPQDISGGSWFYDSGEPQARVGYPVDQQDGKRQCKESSFINDIVSTFGWSTRIQAACDLGFKRDNGSNCVNGNGDFSQGNPSVGDVYAALDKKRTNNTGGHGYNGAQLYVLYEQTLEIACQASPVVAESDANADQKNSGYLDVKVVDGKGNIQNILYKVGKSDDYDFRNREDNLHIIRDSCSKAKDLANQSAGDYAAWVKQHPQPADAPQGDAGGATPTDKTTCAIEGIGWILCPVINFLGKLVDTSYKLLEDNLLKVEPLQFSGGLYNAWSVMRDFANVAFVIAFLIIVFSQVSNVGITNYGIKKMLPKLIVAAILVNTSYLICAVVVDLSNIIGNSLNELMHTIAGKITSPNFNGFSAHGWEGLGGQILGGTLVIVGLGAAALYLGLSIFLPMLIAATLAIVTVVLVLTLRQVLIIILIVISPLALVAYLLPNTEDYFKKWRSLFQTMLVMYPIIALVFGGSALASKIIMGSSPEFAVQVMGAGAAIIPLFITPVVMKSAGGLLNRFGGIVNNKNRGPFDRMRKKADGYRDYRQNIRARNALSQNGPRTFGGGRFRRQARQEAIRNNVKAEMGRENSQYIARELQSNPDFANKMAGGGAFRNAQETNPGALQRALAGAQFTVEKAELEEVQAEAATISNLGAKELRDILDDGGASAGKKAAALDRLVKVGDAGDYADMVSRYGSDDSEESAVIRKTLAKSLSENGPGFVKSSDIDNIARGQLGKEGFDAQGNSTGTIASSLEEIARNNAASGVYSQQKMAGDTKGNLKFAFDHADLPGKQRMVNTANDLKNNETLKGTIKHNADAIDNLSRGTTP